MAVPPAWLHLPDPGGVCTAELRVFAVGRGTLPASASESLDNRNRRTLEGKPYIVLQASLAGEGWFADGVGTYRVAVGEAFLVPIPSPTRYGKDAGQPWERVWISLSGPIALQLARTIVAHGGCRIGRDEVPGLIEGLCALERDARCQPAPPAHVLASAAFALLMRLAAARDRQAGGMPPAVAAALACIHERLRDPDLAVEDLAAAAGLSRFHLSRLFRATVGESPMRHVARRRLVLAAGMLAAGAMSVHAVAGCCGYVGRSNFSAAFRAFHGVPPGRYERQRRLRG